MLVRKVMSSPVVSVTASATILEAAQRMHAHDVGAVPVFEDDRPIGLLTDRDIVMRALAAVKIIPSPETVVEDIMSPDILTCFEDQDVTEAAALMATGRSGVCWSSTGQASRWASCRSAT
jgi:IMP dehydrogenase